MHLLHPPWQGEINTPHYAPTRPNHVRSPHLFVLCMTPEHLRWCSRPLLLPTDNNPRHDSKVVALWQVVPNEAILSRCDSEAFVWSCTPLPRKLDSKTHAIALTQAMVGRNNLTARPALTRTMKGKRRMGFGPHDLAINSPKSAYTYVDEMIQIHAA